MEKIQLQGTDADFATIAQGATVTSATLPSGFKVPSHGTWVIRGQYIVNIHTRAKEVEE